MRRIFSFGYKIGGEQMFAKTGFYAPLILDCRMIRNPHSVPAMRPLTGRDVPVQKFVRADPAAQLILDTAILYLEARPAGTVAFGCSYGKHRSVALALLLAQVYPDAKVHHYWR